MSIFIKFGLQCKGSTKQQVKMASSMHNQ